MKVSSRRQYVPRGRERLARPLLLTGELESVSYSEGLRSQRFPLQALAHYRLQLLQHALRFAFSWEGSAYQ